MISSENFPVGLTKKFLVSRKNFEGKRLIQLLLDTVIVVEFRAKIYQTFGGLFNGSSVKIVIYVSKGAFWGKTTFQGNCFVWFSELEQTFLTHLAEVFGMLVKTAIYVSRGKFRGKNFLRTVDYSHESLCTLDQNSRPFCYKIPSWLWKWIFTRSGNFLGTFFGKSIILYFFGLWEEKLQTFG